MKKINLILINVFMLSILTYAQKFDAKFGKGVNILGKDSSFTMKIGARVQSLYLANWTVNNDDLGKIGDFSSNFLIRRARLKFGGFAFTPRLKYKIELGLSNRDLANASPETKNAPGLILDAVIKYNLFDNLWIWAGQTKLPGNRERIVSSANLQFVDRSILNSKFNADRDMGIQLRYKFNVGSMVFKPIFSFSQGEGRNITAGNIGGGFNYIGKLEWLPFGEFTSKGDYVGADIKRENKPKLAITGAYSFNDNTTREREQLGSYMKDSNDNYITTDVTRYFADLIFKYKGLSITLEYATRSATKNIFYLDSEETEVAAKVYTGSAYNAQVGYVTKNFYEVAARYTKIDYDNILLNDEDMFTLGFSKYFLGHKLKIQTDLSYSLIENKDDKVMFRTQVEVHF